MRGEIFFLNNQGSIITPFSEIKTNKNLTEILIYQNENDNFGATIIYALDDEMKLYMYGVFGENIKTYDILDF